MTQFDSDATLSLSPETLTGYVDQLDCRTVQLDECLSRWARLRLVAADHPRIVARIDIAVAQLVAGAPCYTTGQRRHWLAVSKAIAAIL